VASQYRQFPLEPVLFLGLSVRELSQLRLLLVAVVALVVSIASQNTRPPSLVVPKYDLTTEVRIQGVVVDTNDHECPISGGLGSHLVLQTEDGTVEIHLAPTKFVAQYQLIIVRGDKIEVLGSRVTFDGKDALLAREIVHGQETFVFRDANGKPAW